MSHLHARLEESVRTVFAGRPRVFCYHSSALTALCPSCALCRVAVALAARVWDLWFLLNLGGIAGAKRVEVSYWFLKEMTCHIAIGIKTTLRKLAANQSYSSCHIWDRIVLSGLWEHSTHAAYGVDLVFSRFWGHESCPGFAISCRDCPSCLGASGLLDVCERDALHHGGDGLPCRVWYAGLEPCLWRDGDKNLEVFLHWRFDSVRSFRDLGWYASCLIFVHTWL